MNIIINMMIIFLYLIYLLIIVDIIFSWLRLFWMKLSRPKFLISTIDPIYLYIKKYIPTVFWPFDFTPLIILLFIEIFLHYI